MSNFSFDRDVFSFINKMTSRQQILVFLAVRSMETVDNSRDNLYNRIGSLHKITGLAEETIKDALHFLFLDGHL